MGGWLVTLGTWLEKETLVSNQELYLVMITGVIIGTVIARIFLIDE